MGFGVEGLGSTLGCCSLGCSALGSSALGSSVLGSSALGCSTLGVAFTSTGAEVVVLSVLAAIYILKREKIK